MALEKKQRKKIWKGGNNMATKEGKYTELSSIKKRAFLTAYSECGNISKAVEVSKVSRASHYLWMREDELYPKYFEEAGEEAAEHLEDEARRRAAEGIDKPVFYKGEKCGVIREYSDTLLMFLLKGVKPGKYRDNASLELTGKDGGPIQYEAMTPEQRAERIKELLGKE